MGVWTDYNLMYLPDTGEANVTGKPIFDAKFQDLDRKLADIMNNISGAGEVLPETIFHYAGLLPAIAGAGDVFGPGSVILDRIAVFNGTTGKLIKDGGYTIASLLAAAGDVDGPASAVDEGVAVFDGTTGKLIKDVSGVMVIDVAGGKVGIGTVTPLNALHVEHGLNSNIRISSHEIDATNKRGHLLSSQYESVTEPEGFSLIGSFAHTGGNRVYIGGGATQLNAASIIEFFTAADAVTRTGTLRVTIDSIGNLGVGLAPTVNMSGISIEAGLLTIKETTTPTADTDYGKVYCKADNKLYFQDGAGAEHEVSLADSIKLRMKIEDLEHMVQILTHQ